MLGRAGLPFGKGLVGDRLRQQRSMLVLGFDEPNGSPFRFAPSNESSPLNVRIVFNRFGSAFSLRAHRCLVLFVE